VESISSADIQAPHARIPGVTAILQTITAVMFTNRLRGVKTCNLCTTVPRGWRVDGLARSVASPGRVPDVPYKSQIIPNGRVIRVEREIFHHGKLLSGNGRKERLRSRGKLVARIILT